MTAHRIQFLLLKRTYIYTFDIFAKMAERKGLNSKPMDSSKLNFNKIPNMADFKCQFCNQMAISNVLSCPNCFQFEDVQQQLILVINAPIFDGSSLALSHGTIAKKFFHQVELQHTQLIIISKIRCNLYLINHATFLSKIVFLLDFIFY